MRSGSPVLVVGPAGANSGFGRVTAGLLRCLHGHVDVHHLASDLARDAHGSCWPVYGNPIGVDPFAETRLVELVSRLRPLVLVVQDLTMLARYRAVLRPLDPTDGRLPLIAYCAVDGEVTDPSVARPAAGLARVVAFTQAGRRRVLKAWSRLPASAAPIGDLRVDVIGHGVDQYQFGPVLGRAGPRSESVGEARCRLGWRLPTDAYVVLNSSRNQARKRLDLTLRAFAKTASLIPHAYLWLHTANRTVVGRDVRAYAHDLGISDRLLSPSADDAGHDAPEECLNLLYNACDVGLNTSLGESWGLASFEHALTGAPQVLTRTAVSEELWADAAVLVPGRPVALGTMLRGTEVDVDAVAAVLVSLDRDPARRDELGRRASDLASSPSYGWNACGALWRHVVDDVMNDETVRWLP